MGGSRGCSVWGSPGGHSVGPPGGYSVGAPQEDAACGGPPGGYSVWGPPESKGLTSWVLAFAAPRLLGQEVLLGTLVTGVCWEVGSPHGARPWGLAAI